MRILFTGATSFTGMWFAERLAEAGHSVLAAIRGSQDSYSDLKGERLARLTRRCDVAWNTPFGTSAFLELVRNQGPFDLLCHHAAEVTDYKSPDFDITGAVAANCHNLSVVLSALRRTGCHRVVLTGSIFEAGEGAGTAPLRAFSPYGLSKTLTAQIFQYRAGQEGLALGKFVIPNPFGPFEEPRFTDYLMRTWKNGEAAAVRTPDYVRDNIPVSLLAAAYARFAAELPASGFFRFNPSYYVETQGAFAQRFATEMHARLRLETPLALATQLDFPEPEVRINTDILRGHELDWTQTDFWNELGRYYARRMGIPTR